MNVSAMGFQMPDIDKIDALLVSSRHARRETSTLRLSMLMYLVGKGACAYRIQSLPSSGIRTLYSPADQIDIQYFQLPSRGIARPYRRLSFVGFPTVV